MEADGPVNSTGTAAGRGQWVGRPAVVVWFHVGESARVRLWWFHARGLVTGLLVASLVGVVWLAGESELGGPLDHQSAGLVDGGWVFGCSAPPYVTRILRDH